MLDSNHSTEVAGAQTQWFERALAERTDREHLMVAYHIPAYPSVKLIGSEDGDDIRQHWSHCSNSTMSTLYSSTATRTNVRISYETANTILMKASCILAMVRGVKDPEA